MFKLSRKELAILIMVPMVAFFCSSIYASNKHRKKRSRPANAVIRPNSQTQPCVAEATITHMSLDPFPYNDMEAKGYLSCKTVNGSSYPCSFSIVQSIYHNNMLVNSQCQNFLVLCNATSNFDVLITTGGLEPGSYVYSVKVYSGGCGGSGSVISSSFIDFTI